MRLVTTPYPKRPMKRNVRDLIDLATDHNRRTFRNIERDKEVVRLRKKGTSVPRIAQLFSISERQVHRIDERFASHFAEYNAFIDSELARKPVERIRLLPRYYFESCLRCHGTMYGDEKFDTRAYELDCLDCGFNVSASPLKMTARVENWDYERANHRSNNS